MKLNNKGFTLVELLAVLVILIAISSIAIPAISSSLDRSKGKQTKAKEKLLLSAAELYITDHKNNIASDKSCYISVNELIQNDYIDDDDEIEKDSYIIYTKPSTYETSTNSESCSQCISTE